MQCSGYRIAVILCLQRNRIRPATPFTLLFRLSCITLRRHCRDHGISRALEPERCLSGLKSTPGKCVYVNSVSRVRIPPSPPLTSSRDKQSQSCSPGPIRHPRPAAQHRVGVSPNRFDGCRFRQILPDPASQGARPINCLHRTGESPGSFRAVPSHPGLSEFFRQIPVSDGSVGRKKGPHSACGPGIRGKNLRYVGYLNFLISPLWTLAK